MLNLVTAQQNFTVSDPSLPDNPIVYASEGFLKLTGYTREQVRNGVLVGLGGGQGRVNSWPALATRASPPAPFALPHRFTPLGCLASLHPRSHPPRFASPPLHAPPLRTAPPRLTPSPFSAGHRPQLPLPAGPENRPEDGRPHP